MRRLLVAMLLSCLPLSAWAQDDAPTGPDCSTLDDCISILREHQIEPPPAPNAYRSSGISDKPIQRAIDRLAKMGDPAVVALIALFDDPNFNVRKRASYALFHFGAIDARHAPALIAEQRRDGVWLDTAIARTGTDEAMAFLWDAVLAKPEPSGNAAFRALVRVGDRILPAVEAKLGDCRTARDTRQCRGVMELAKMFDPLPAFFYPLVEAIATSPDAAPDLREEAEGRLIMGRQPYGVKVLVGRLEARAKGLRRIEQQPNDPDNFTGSFTDADDIEYTFGAIGGYGVEAVSAGPLVVRFMRETHSREVRNAGLQALGQIGYRDGIDAVLEQGGDFVDDWYTAYNAAEALGRLGGGRSELEQLMRMHWSAAVRHNAERALNFLDTGVFARPGVAGDGDEPTLPEVIYVSIGRWYGPETRYAGDRIDEGRACRAEATRFYPLLPVADSAWPGAGQPAVALETYDEDADDDSDDADSVTADPQWQAFVAQHKVMSRFTDVGWVFAAAFGASVLVGENHGEFGGGVYAIDRKGRALDVDDGNALAVFVNGDRAFVVTQTSLLVLDLKADWPVVSRDIRLPGAVEGYAVHPGKVLVIATEHGDVAITTEGVLLDPVKVAC